MSENELKHYREMLRKSRSELLAGLRKRDDIAIEKTADELDEVQLAGSRDLAIQELDRKAHRLGKVNAALERIADGSYGTCENCGEEIGARRLAAVPWTSLCLRCQEEEDRRKDPGTERTLRGILGHAA